MSVNFNFADFVKNFSPERSESIKKFLQDKCCFNCSMDETTVNFKGEHPIKYFEPICLYQNSKLNEKAIDDLQNWLIRYPNYPGYKIEDIDEMLKRFEKAKGIKNNLYILQQLIFFSPRTQLEDILTDKIIPRFNELFPKGSVSFIKIDNSIHMKISAMRMFYSIKEVPDILQLLKGQKIKGFETLRFLQNSTRVGFPEVIKPFFILFSPYMTGISAERVEGSFVFLFDKPGNYKGNYPETLTSLTRSEDVTYFSEHFKTPQDCEKQIQSNTFTNDEILPFFNEYIDGLNCLYSYLVDPINFGDRSSVLDSKRWFLTYLTINRIAYDVIIIGTEFMSQYICRVLFFGVLDKISELIANHPRKICNNATGAFKDLLRKSMLETKLCKILREQSDPFGNYFANKCKEAVNDVYKTIEEGIFIPTVKRGAQITINSQKKDDIEEFVISFLREIRNTTHGYITHKSEFLAVHNGNISNKISLLAIYLWLAILRRPKDFIEGEIFRPDEV